MNRGTTRRARLWASFIRHFCKLLQPEEKSGGCDKRRGKPRKEKCQDRRDAPAPQISRCRGLPCPGPVASRLFCFPPSLIQPRGGEGGGEIKIISEVILHPPLPKGKCNNATSVSTGLRQRCLINTLFLQERSWQERAGGPLRPSLPALPPPPKLASSIQLQFFSSAADKGLNVTRPGGFALLLASD